MSPEAITSRLKELFAERAESEGIVAAWLFGSVARGTAGPRSDVDVAVLYSKGPPPGLAGLGLSLEGDLERMLGLPVQVVVLNRASVDLIHRVLRDGVLLVDRDRCQPPAPWPRSLHGSPSLLTGRCQEGYGNLFPAGRSRPRSTGPGPTIDNKERRAHEF